jgi:hypothetical protein
VGNDGDTGVDAVASPDDAAGDAWDDACAGDAGAIQGRDLRDLLVPDHRACCDGRDVDWDQVLLDHLVLGDDERVDCGVGWEDRDRVVSRGESGGVDGRVRVRVRWAWRSGRGSGGWVPALCWKGWVLGLVVR